ncbi:MAG: 7-cyano-7-deazaguanine synthase [Candidatus Woesearchaeota archaeon]|nr:7-cyano-7-deazaguanine synthase [Candidatus Woesearchaeota archaeon]
MQCSKCKEPAVISEPARCKKHFLADFEQKVKDTIERFQLLQKGQKIAVAASGGKDSLTIMVLLKKWYENVTAITIDEGIEGYRAKTMEDLQRVCKEQNIPLITKSYKDFTGYTLDEMLKKQKFHPCTICGTFRRHLISIASKEFDVLVTGHNADDEAQTILMNLLKGNTDIFPRNGPKTGVGAKGFTQRVKPLYFCTEKEVATFAFLNGFVSEFIECPNAPEGFRYLIRTVLNNHGTKETKQHILEQFLKMKETFPTKSVELPPCKNCGEPSARETCKTCEFLMVVQS